MKKVLLIVALVLCAGLASAQELSVQSFKLRTTDMTAKVNPVYDANHDACALIKVAIVGSNVSFEGNIVKDENHTTGEYYVYMPAGSRKLTIYSQSFLPLEVVFSTYDISLEKNLTYELRISTPQQQKLLNRQYLVMSVYPEDSDVYIDDIMQRVDKDGVVVVELLCGEHKYRVDHAGCMTKEGVFTIETAEKTELSVSLRNNTGTIKVESPSVPEANVYINGELSGLTPFTSEPLKSGRYEIRVTKAGYYVFSKTLVLRVGDSETVVADLKSSFSTVRLKSLSAGADIYLDGKLVSQGSWEGNLDAGKHIVELKKEGYADVTEILEVKSGENEDITLPELIPLYGVLNVSSSPFNATVYVDGLKIGSTPLLTNQITVGRHQMLVEKDGYKSKILEIEVLRDSTVSFELKLSKGHGEKEVEHKTV